jgi:hypothetical protein
VIPSTDRFARSKLIEVNMKKLAVRKLDVSPWISNLLLAFAVVAASAPVLLGDRLVLIASDVLRQGAIMLQEFSIFLQRLLG